MKLHVRPIDFNKNMCEQHILNPWEGSLYSMLSIFWPSRLSNQTFLTYEVGIRMDSVSTLVLTWRKESVNLPKIKLYLFDDYPLKFYLLRIKAIDLDQLYWPHKGCAIKLSCGFCTNWYHDTPFSSEYLLLLS